MATTIKAYFRESQKTYLKVIKSKFYTKAEIDASQLAQTAKTIKLDGYSKPAAAGAIGANDTTQVAIGKLEKGLESATAGGGDANVQSDWDEATTGSDAFIKNKPDLTNLHAHANKAILDATTASYLVADKAKIDKLDADPDAKYATKTSVDDINTILTSDDTTLNDLQEVVTYIKQNKSDLSSLNLDNIAETATKKHFTTVIRDSLAFTDITAVEANTDWDNA